MSKLFEAETSAEAWVLGMEHLLKKPDGKDFNLVLSIARPDQEIKPFTKTVDALAEDTESASTMENANAIWPYVLATPGRALPEVVKRIKEFAAPLIKRANATHADSYVQRIVGWRSRDGVDEVPQLENLIERMKTEIGRAAPKSSCYEVAIFSPGLDAGYMSFPCLSHLSFKLDNRERKLHLTALYRNHHYISHAYGNLLGLGRLMRFVAQQVGIEVGELVVISTHADAELNKGRQGIRTALAKARALVETHATPRPARQGDAIHVAAPASAAVESKNRRP